jgi:hypothetical protein
MAKLISAIFLLMISVHCRADIKPDSFMKSRFVTRFVQNLPEQTANKILIISTRRFVEKNNFAFRKGVDPHFRLYYFIATHIGDTAYVKHIPDMDSASTRFESQKSFLIYVDGYGKNFEQTMERGFELSERFNLNMVVFDWPTDYMTMRKAVYNATEVTVGFIKSMQTFDDFHKRYFEQSVVSVVFHSLGNHIIRNIAIQDLMNKMPANLFTNIILNAAAVPQGNHKKWVERLNIQKRIYITKNEHDFNLRGAAILRMTRLLGLSSKAQYAKNAYYVDFGEIATFEHNLFLGKSELESKNPDIFKFYNMAFQGKEVLSADLVGFHILRPSEKSVFFSVR